MSLLDSVCNSRKSVQEAVLKVPVKVACKMPPTVFSDMNK